MSPMLSTHLVDLAWLLSEMPWSAVDADNLRWEAYTDPSSGQVIEIARAHSYFLS